eukprot:m.23660 g.23660  ORF g.23660 m.23660 type:complete len:422 (-) comp3926_c0_seq1:184-1449(-)
MPRTWPCGAHRRTSVGAFLPAIFWPTLLRHVCFFPWAAATGLPPRGRFRPPFSPMPAAMNALDLEVSCDPGHVDIDVRGFDGGFPLAISAVLGLERRHVVLKSNAELPVLLEFSSAPIADSQHEISLSLVWSGMQGTIALLVGPNGMRGWTPIHVMSELAEAAKCPRNRSMSESAANDGCSGRRPRRGPAISARVRNYVAERASAAASLRVAAASVSMNARSVVASRLAHEAELKTLARRVADAEDIAAAAQVEQQRLEQSVRALTARLAAKDRTIADLQGQVDDLAFPADSDELSHLRTENAWLREQLQAFADAALAQRMARRLRHSREMVIGLRTQLSGRAACRTDDVIAPATSSPSADEGNASGAEERSHRSMLDELSDVSGPASTAGSPLVTPRKAALLATRSFSMPTVHTEDQQSS